MPKTKEASLVVSFTEACKVKGYDPEAVLPNLSGFPEPHRKALEATAKMYIIAEALNGDWKPNWNDDDEYKYFPWFDMEVDADVNPSGFRFNAAFYAYTYARTSGGSRLCFRTRKLAEHAGQTFLELYRDMMVLPKE